MGAARDPAAHRLLLGRLAGLLFLTGAVASLPVNHILEPATGARSTWMTALGIASGILCLVLPWRRLPDWSLSVLATVAVLEVAATMWGVGGDDAHVYAWFAVLVVVFVAYAFSDRRLAMGHSALAIAVLSVPLLLGGGHQDAMAEIFVAVPILLVAGGVVIYLREELEARQRALAEQARVDPLTGVGNRRLLDERLAYELTRHRRSGKPLSLLVLDLDRFKDVNDTLGHPAGDAVLREVAQRLLDAVREQDTVVRQGGDEFCVLAPEAGRGEVPHLIARVKQAVSGVVALGQPVTASVGCAVFPDDATDSAALVAQADLEQRRDKATVRRPGRPALGLVG